MGIPECPPRTAVIQAKQADLALRRLISSFSALQLLHDPTFQKVGQGAPFSRCDGLQLDVQGFVEGECDPGFLGRHSARSCSECDEP